MSHTIIRIKEVQRKVGRGTSWIYEAMKRGEFPRPVRLGADKSSKGVGWIEAELDEWIQRRIAARDEAESTR